MTLTIGGSLAVSLFLVFLIMAMIWVDDVLDLADLVLDVAYFGQCRVKLAARFVKFRVCPLLFYWYMRGVRRLRLP